MKKEVSKENVSASAGSKNVRIDIPEDVYKRLTILSFLRNKSRQEILEELVNKNFQKYKKDIIETFNSVLSD